MKPKTDFKTIEKKFRTEWEKQDWYRVKTKNQESKIKIGEKFYVLVEFPYPSGAGLHIGHAFTMTGADIYARKKRMDGYNVLFPMGWDAFGLPTENYAIKTGISPQKATKDNTDAFRREMKEMAFSFDWDREINSTDPKYYKWTQWIFVQLFKHGLAYKEEKAINWCPSCKTGLANEEVIDGKCERCGAQASKKNLSQWIVKITDYADRLIDGLKKTDFIEKVKAAQINWIDRKEWIDITYQVDGIDEEIVVATTRPDTNFGATFVIIAPEHPLVAKIQNPKSKFQTNFKFSNSKIEEIRRYVEETKKKSELERQQDVGQAKKTGVFTGLYAVNQLNNQKMPIWITDFVLMTVGTGAVVGVPGHDLRDFDFAKTFDLPVVRVVAGKNGETSPITEREQVQEEEGRMVNSGFLNGMEIHDAIGAIMDHIEKEGWGKRSIRYHLRDWIFSRQHYWGEPIPMIFCQRCADKRITWWDTKQVQSSKFKVQSYNSKFKIDKEVKEKTVGFFPVEDKDLPVELPEVEKYQPTDTGKSPLAAMTDWVKTTCPHCGGPATRETDTMPNWAGSDWYFLAYIFASKLENSKSQITNSKQSQNFNDQNPKQKSLKNLNLKNSDLFGVWNLDIGISQNIFESSKNVLGYWLPVDVYIGGDEHNTLHLLYSRFIYQFLWDIGVLPEFSPEPYYRRISHGVILGPDGQRMSKSRGNVIVPGKICAKHGVDVVRTYMMFMGPFEATMIWNDNALKGVERFLKKFKNLIQSSKFPERFSSKINGAGKIPSYAKASAGRQNDKVKTESKDTSGVGFDSPDGGVGGKPVKVAINKDTSEVALSEVEWGSSDGGGDVKQVRVLINQLIKKVSGDLDTFRFNTAIAAMMEAVNNLTLNI
ncbi:class I tRNA ligase family protein, partial [Patescibacteria group bacterium]|nr:class I tRNA ligase family protein [Patescibacteria group bacterium]